MKRFLLVALLLLFGTGVWPMSSSLAAACGTERWSVKTGVDPDAAKVDTNAVSATTVAAMIQLSPPTHLPENSRIQPTETTVWTISATLVGYKLETDSDYHLVISDAQNQTMIVEIPSPSCVGATSPFLQAIAHVRSQFDARFTPTSQFQIVSLPVQVTGVGFFDRLHGQTGVAPNGIELHPVLDLVFNPPEATATPPASGQTWEYRLMSASTGEAMLTQLNDLSDQWELVSVVLDDQRTDRYVAYLKRPK